jgi:alpha-N-arabinofuranosidase
MIGNEMYGDWQFGYMALDQYWVKHNFIVEAMRKVDPKIKVTVSGASICEKSVGGAEKRNNFFPDPWEAPMRDKLPYEFGSQNDWDGWLLEKCPGTIDFLSEHTYAYPDLAFDADKQLFVDVHDPMQFRARRLANRIGEAFEAWDKYVEKMPSLKDKASNSSLMNGAIASARPHPTTPAALCARPECWCRSRTRSACMKCFATPIRSRPVAPPAGCAC